MVLIACTNASATTLAIFETVTIRTPTDLALHLNVCTNRSRSRLCPPNAPPKSIKELAVATDEVARALPPSPGRVRSGHLAGLTRRGTPRPQCPVWPRARACSFLGKLRHLQRSPSSTPLLVFWDPTSSPTCSRSIPPVATTFQFPPPCRQNCWHPCHPLFRPPCHPPFRPQQAYQVSIRGRPPKATRPSCKALLIFRSLRASLRHGMSFKPPMMARCGEWD